MSVYDLFHDTYKTILGRNNYNQSLRQYVFTPLNGKYYSDCSSSGCATYQKCGVNISLLNTAGMHNSPIGKKVSVNIKDGHITNPTVLRVGDALLFRGNTSRPLYIGHVEYVYEIKGKTEKDITICGHGSGKPSLKNLGEYLATRHSSKMSNDIDKGLVEVIRFLPEVIDEVLGTLRHGDIIKPDTRLVGTTEIPISTDGLKCTASALNIRRKPDYAITDRWFKIGDGYVSARYFEGFIKDEKSEKKKWYLLEGYNYYTKKYVTIGDRDYAFNRDGYVVWEG